MRTPKEISADRKRIVDKFNRFEITEEDALDLLDPLNEEYRLAYQWAISSPTTQLCSVARQITDEDTATD